MFICPDCRSVYAENLPQCERDGEPLIAVQANQNIRTYPLLNHELDGRYHLIGGLGQGGVGTVYLANHIHLDRLSAVKFLDMDMLIQADNEQKEESLKDFVKEAKLAMFLRHDSVVHVMDYGVYEGSPFLVMEYIPGPSLLRRMNAGEKFSIEQCLNIIGRIAEALNAFHERRLVHRDLKPANVILDPRDNGQLTLVDLGLVKDLSSEARSSTHPLALRGTPGYLAPEQVPNWVLSSAGVNVNSDKQPVDARVDIFALGVLSYELLTGQPPYPKGLSPTKVIIHTCTREPTPLESLCPELSDYPGLATLVKRMMAKRPQERPKNGQEVIERVQEIIEEMQGKGSPKALRDEIQRAQDALSLRLRRESGSQGALISPPHSQEGPRSNSLIAPPSSTPSNLYAHGEHAPSDESTITGELDESLSDPLIATHIIDSASPVHMSAGQQGPPVVAPPLILSKSTTPPPLKEFPERRPSFITPQRGTFDEDLEQNSFDQEHTEIFQSERNPLSSFGETEFESDMITSIADRDLLGHLSPSSSKTQLKLKPLLLWGGIILFAVGLGLMFTSIDEPSKIQRPSPTQIFLGEKIQNPRPRPRSPRGTNSTSLTPPRTSRSRLAPPQMNTTRPVKRGGAIQLPSPKVNAEANPRKQADTRSNDGFNEKRNRASPIKKETRSRRNRSNRPNRVTQRSPSPPQPSPKKRTSSRSADRSTTCLSLTPLKFQELSRRTNQFLSQSRKEDARVFLSGIRRKLCPRDSYSIEIQSLLDSL